MQLNVYEVIVVILVGLVGISPFIFIAFRPIYKRNRKFFLFIRNLLVLGFVVSLWFWSGPVAMILGLVYFAFVGVWFLSVVSTFFVGLMATRFQTLLGLLATICIVFRTAKYMESMEPGHMDFWLGVGVIAAILSLGLSFIMTLIRAEIHTGT